MRIGIDATSWSNTRGYGRFTRELVEAMVAEGRVQVDGQTELRKTCKLRLGQVVSVAGARVRLVAEPPPLDRRQVETR